MKLKHKIVIAIFLGGLLLSFLANTQHKKLLKMAVEPINKELSSLKKENKQLVSKIKKDSLETLKLIKEKKLLVIDFSKKLDSLNKIKKKDEKAIIEYSGDFNSRFAQFSNNLTSTN